MAKNLMYGHYYNVLNFGAVGDGITLETLSIQNTLDTCSNAGGGTVFVPAGKYLCGTIFFHSNITLHLDAGAVLLGSENVEDYPISQNRWEGAEQPTYSPLIAGHRLENITITGRGTVNGQGKYWWDLFNQKALKYPRPRLVGFNDCKNVLIENITAINSPSWTINPVRCENVQIHGLTIINPPDSPNTDGINPDSCSYVRISDCYVSVGDDCITLKAGTENELLAYQAACHDITITNCTLANGHGGVVIGSEMSGGVYHVTISNCIFSGTDRGIRLKSRRGRGGLVEDIRITNLIMKNVLCPFTMNLYYGCGAWGDPIVSDKSARPIGLGTPSFRHIHFSYITARDVKYAAGFIYGLEEMPIEDISFSNISVTMAEKSESGYPEMADGLETMHRAGFFIRNVNHLRLDQVEIYQQVGPAFRIENSTKVNINGCDTFLPKSALPQISLENVEDCTIQSSLTSQTENNPVLFEGKNNTNISIFSMNRQHDQNNVNQKRDTDHKLG
jgi:polygalacturonase